jgi:diguanylate cyclase (GGDEF)-like protein
MKPLLAFWQARVRDRADSEHAQALVRTVVVWLLLVHTAWLAAAERDTAVVLWAVNVFSAGFSLALLARVLHTPRVSPFRRMLGAVHDNVCVTIWLYHAGPTGALALFVYPFVTVGNGFRYGVRYLALSGVLGAAGIALLLTRAPGWSSDSMFGAGFLLSHVVVTFYTGALLRQLYSTQRKLRTMATHDPLTGLPNRRWFMETLSRMMSSGATRQLACLYVDLDGFKCVNDRYGHNTGDRLLNEVGAAVLRCVRMTDVVARLGGDEFTVVLTSPCSPQHAREVAARIIRAVEGIAVVDGHPVDISASIGISFLPAGEADHLVGSDEVLKAADAAMYAAKRSGRGLYRFSDFSGGVFVPAA